ncbi:hypothetical protein [Aliirhizobium cellulosilyticum]|uniref:Uncharacterized protein n=2 Tax=Aliirhizobium cellulosilyticum TaxID=393664 RepID=A0A7W6Y4D7_9HYPH|nr:hypothetical protein [Rhizobium cellulosilyticum]MBB4412448.1 hypothetical protein [Rhizobium cellulosilyticum]MBB4447080.1 hypothetical protein [Rhizobium cellulosilyticum]
MLHDDKSAINKVCTMSTSKKKELQPVRDGIDMLPEMVDLQLELEPEKSPSTDELLDEALLETFPASDPIASGRFD